MPFGCHTEGWARAGFEVHIECHVPGDLPDIEVLRDPASGMPVAFQSIDEAVLAAQERLADLENQGKQCIAHIVHVVSTSYSVLVVRDSNGRYRLPAESCLKWQTSRGGPGRSPKRPQGP